MTVITCGETVTVSPRGLGDSVSELHASALAEAAGLGPGDGTVDRDEGGIPELRLLCPAASTGDLMPADSSLRHPCCRGSCRV